MAETDYSGAEASSRAANTAEKKEPDARLQSYWREIARYDKATEDWRNDGEQIVKLYLDEGNQGTVKTTRHFPLLWANVETLKPAVYAKMPIVQCSRRHKDRDPSGRIAAEILERCANTTFDLYNIDEILRMVRDDRLLPGRGQAWVRYEPKLEGEKLVGERVCVDYVHWQDFGHSLARTWSDVRMVWRRVYKTRDECEKRFGKEKANKLVYNAKGPDDKEQDGYKACVYEIWDKAKGVTLWIAKEFHEIIEEGAPPLNFMGFFPCPEPCYATKTSKSLIPTPDYRYYRDQAKEINDLTQKIASLTDWLKLQGFVPAAPASEGANAVQNLVARITNPDTILVQVESWAAFSEKGGAGKIIDWLPVKEVALALREAITVRAQIIQDVFQITGISDIIRGQTDPNETLGAQELKAQTGSRRLKNTRDEIVRFSRDLARLVCEVIAEQFQPETLAAMSGFKYLPPPEPNSIALPNALPGQPGVPAPQGAPLAPPGGAPPNMNAPEQAGVFTDEVVSILRDDQGRSFRIDIETDSTIQPDEDAEKQRRIEFLGAVGQFVNQTKEVAGTMPALMPVLGKALLFLVRGFRAGRELEDEIERGVEGMMAQIQQMQNQPKQDPETVKAQAKAEIDKKMADHTIAIEGAKAENERQIAQENAANDRDIAQKNAENDREIARQKAAQEAEAKAKADDDERARKQINHATETKLKEEGVKKEIELKDTAAKAELDNKQRVVDSDEKVKAAESIVKTTGEMVAQAVEKMGEAVLDKLSKTTLKTAPRVRKPKYDDKGNITEVREEDAA